MAVRKTNPQTGQVYRVQPATGGVFHVYADGRKVFVPTQQPQYDWTPVQKASWQAAAQQLGVGAPAPAPAAPVDSTAVEEGARRQASINAQLTGNEQEGTANLAAKTEALRRLTADQPKDIVGAKTSANKAGLFYSSTLGNQLDDIASAYTRRRSDVESDFTRSENARLAARGVIQAGGTVDDATSAAAATGRQIVNDSGAADAGTLVPNPPAAPAAPKVQAPRVVAARPQTVRRQPVRRPVRRPRRP